MSSQSQIQEVTFCLIFYLTRQAHQSAVWHFLVFGLNKNDCNSADVYVNGVVQW